MRFSRAHRLPFSYNTTHISSRHRITSGPDPGPLRSARGRPPTSDLRWITFTVGERRLTPGLGQAVEGGYTQPHRSNSRTEDHDTPEVTRVLAKVVEVAAENKIICEFDLVPQTVSAGPPPHSAGFPPLSSATVLLLAATGLSDWPV